MCGSVPAVGFGGGGGRRGRGVGSRGQGIGGGEGGYGDLGPEPDPPPPGPLFFGPLSLLIRPPEMTTGGMTGGGRSCGNFRARVGWEGEDGWCRDPFQIGSSPRSPPPIVFSTFLSNPSTALHTAAGVRSNTASVSTWSLPVGGAWEEITNKRHGSGCRTHLLGVRNDRESKLINI